MGCTWKRLVHQYRKTLETASSVKAESASSLIPPKKLPEHFELMQRIQKAKVSHNCRDSL